jgi:hypothetical protein
MPIPRPFTITDVKAIRLLASPVRQAILAHIVASGPLTVAQHSAELHRPADRLYYHVRLLERAGLLRATDASPASGRPESAFDVPGRPMQLKYEPRQPANRKAVGRVLRGVLRSARGDVDRALNTGTARVSGTRRELWAGRVSAALTQDELGLVNSALQDLLARFGRARGRATAGGRRYQFTWALSPEEPGTTAAAPDRAARTRRRAPSASSR